MVMLNNINLDQTEASAKKLVRYWGKDNSATGATQTRLAQIILNLCRELRVARNMQRNYERDMADAYRNGKKDGIESMKSASS